MSLTFYPHSDDADKGTLEERIDILLEAAERYKVAVVDSSVTASDGMELRPMVPRELKHAFNWEEIARVLRSIRELGEINKSDKLRKAHLLTRLAEIYEMLRAAKMAKLEAVRLALMSEAMTLRNSSS